MRYDGELFTDDAKEVADSNFLKSNLRTSKYYLIVLAFLGLGYLVITKVQKGNEWSPDIIAKRIKLTD